jgi:hypothetical protein
MGYFFRAEPETAVPAKSLADPKTHTPFLRVKERGLRFYFPTLGRWLSRDPIGEHAFMVRFLESKHRELVETAKHSLTADPRARDALLTARLYRLRQKLEQEALKPLYVFVENDPIVKVDRLGMLAVHCRWCGPGWTGGRNQASYDYDWLNDLMDDGNYVVDDDLDECCFLCDLLRGDCVDCRRRRAGARSRHDAKNGITNAIAILGREPIIEAW